MVFDARPGAPFFFLGVQLEALHSLQDVATSGRNVVRLVVDSRDVPWVRSACTAARISLPT
jgi:hypothetical protein